MPSIVRAAIAALSLACGGCAYTGQMLLRGEAITNQTLDFDSAIAESDRQMIIANVLRARDRESMSFSRLSILRGSMTRQISGGVGSEIAEGEAGDTFSPNFSLSDSSAPSFDVPVLNTQKFSRAIHAEIGQSTYHLLLAEGFQPGLLHMLFLGEMSLSCGLILDLNDAYTAGRLRGLTATDVRELNAGVAHCTRGMDPDGGGPLPMTITDARRRELVRFVNDPTDPEPFEQFGHWLRILLSEPEAALTICPSEEETPIGPPITVATGADIQGIVAAAAADDLSWQEPPKTGPEQWRLLSSSVNHKFGLGCGANARHMTLHDEAEDTKPASPGAGAGNPTPPPIAHFQVRSVHDVMLYLGQIVREQNPANPIEVPRFDMSNTQANGAVTYEWQPILATTGDDLFVLRQGEAPDGVEVYHHGVTYTASYTLNGCAPETRGDCPARGEQDRTQQVIHLMLQLFGMLQEREDLPVSSVVTITR